MKITTRLRLFQGILGCLAIVFVLLTPSTTSAADEEKFDVLQIGTQTYSNVTVTTKSPKYVFLVHSVGMANIKVADLPLDARIQLGYEKPAEARDPNATPRTAKEAAAWAKDKIQTINVKDMNAQALESSLETKLTEKQKVDIERLKALAVKYVFVALGFALIAYLFTCYCFAQICAKAGKPGGILVWLPVLQLFALFRAAAMSPVWCICFLLPGLSVAAASYSPQLILLFFLSIPIAFIATLVMWVKLAKARGKSAIVGLLMMLPITNIFALLYLAFSDGGKDSSNDRRGSNIMSLETA